METVRNSAKLMERESFNDVVIISTRVTVNRSGEDRGKPSSYCIIIATDGKNEDEKVVPK